MRDLHPRWNLLIVLVAFASLLGCGALQADPRFGQNGGTNGSLVASSPNLNFGSVVVGSRGQAFEYVFNPTNRSVTVSSAAASTGDFHVVSPTLPVTLSPHKGVRLLIAFQPSTPGTSSATILISSTAPGTGIAIPVSGQAVAAGNLTVSPSSVSFGSVAVGKSQSRAAMFTNSGQTSVTISRVAASATDFAISGISFPVVLRPGASAGFNLIFTPRTSGMRRANILASASASLVLTSTRFQTSTQTSSATTQDETATIVAAGMGTQTTPSDTTLGQLTPSPTSLGFGSPQVPSTQSKPLVVTNSGSASITITQAMATGDGYMLSGPSLPLTLSANQSASFSITFAPQAAGAAAGNVVISSNAANPSLNVTLSATPVSAGVLAVSANPLVFGSVKVGSSQNVTASLRNSGGSSITLTKVAVSGTGFSMGNMAVPMTLAPNQSANVSITCAPQSAGTLAGNLSVASDASNPTVTVPLSGTAVAAGALTAGSSSLSFGQVTVGKTATLPETLTNNGGTAINLTAMAAGGGYTVTGLNLPMQLNAGQSASFSVVFTPQSAGNSNINLAITNDGPNPTFTVPLSGTGEAPGTLTAGSVSFGNVQVGVTSTKTATLTNSGGASVTVSQANLTGTGFGMSALSLPLTLAAGQSFTFSVTFDPAATGASNGSIALTSDASGATPAIALSGTGTSAGQFSVSPGTFSFGSVTVGASKSLPATLSASGASVTVTSASVDSSEFAISGLKLPITIPAGGSTAFTVTFSPQSGGATSGTATFGTSAPNSPISAAVSGSGAAAPQHSVNLSWNPSSSDVTGYNVYRGTASGGPYAKVNNTTDTSYTDTSVQSGQTYYYVTTSVATGGSESTYSNQVSATIPTP